ncbi:hypothetical protein GLAREA_00047 [Glarea lozoyensis ATCC 20868]|uniref:Uncharacterized protein n=1 Tax=Glarea lozoyensis (strain ATCC 20868 / MF5171) TaxID=1116229 RepID=S3CVA5_GLAL2|nr:uncharacterized protein GLAREA_00047 [Glarea lozoyensis ATCC 20868]EPE28889.1 hypothetical protein GLAREA_00047 [Glarea lozoyensis ATCC 20868]
MKQESTKKHGERSVEGPEYGLNGSTMGSFNSEQPLGGGAMAWDFAWTLRGSCHQNELCWSLHFASQSLTTGSESLSISEIILKAAIYLPFLYIEAMDYINERLQSIKRLQRASFIGWEPVFRFIQLQQFDGPPPKHIWAIAAPGRCYFKQNHSGNLPYEKDREVGESGLGKSPYPFRSDDGKGQRWAGWDLDLPGPWPLFLPRPRVYASSWGSNAVFFRHFLQKLDIMGEDSEQADYSPHCLSTTLSLPLGPKAERTQKAMPRPNSIPASHFDTFLAA